MAMIDPNVMKAVAEVFQTHGITPNPSERLADTVALALNLSDAEANRWIDALTEGCTVEEANRRAGIADHRGTGPLLVAVARAIGSALGRVAR